MKIYYTARQLKKKKTISRFLFFNSEALNIICDFLSVIEKIDYLFRIIESFLNEKFLTNILFLIMLKVLKISYNYFALFLSTSILI